MYSRLYRKFDPDLFKVIFMKRFENQVAVISGAADGLGFGIAERIASEGGSIALFDINERTLSKALQILKNKGYRAEGFKTDVSSEYEVQRSIQFAADTFGKIDIMVNSAGIVGPTNTKITNYSTEEYDKIYAINLRGTNCFEKNSVSEEK